MSLMRYLTAFALIAATTSISAWSETPGDLLAAFEHEARQGDAEFKGFSNQRGQQLFQRTHGSDWSCASCHTDTPAQPGKHAKTGKAIAPLAPASNPERFTSVTKVEKWFKRNCNDVLGRACTPQEKGDVLSWLMTIKN